MNPLRLGVRRERYCLITKGGIAGNWRLTRSRSVARGKMVMIGHRRGDLRVRLPPPMQGGGSAMVVWLCLNAADGAVRTGNRADTQV